MKKKYLLNPYEERLGFLTGGPPNRIAIKGDLLPVALQTALQLAVRFEVHQPVEPLKNVTLGVAVAPSKM